MTFRQRFFLIMTLVVITLVAIASGPAFKRTVTPVRAAPNPPAVAIMTCSSTVETGGVLPGALSQPKVNNVDFTLGLALVDFGAFQTGQDCAAAIQALALNGFTRQGEATTVFAASVPGGANGGTYSQWVFEKASGDHD